MLVFINACKSITRSKGRNILIGLIVLTIAVSGSIALAIRTAAEAAKKSGTEAQTITGSISVDRQKLMEGVRNGYSEEEMDDLRGLMRQYEGLSLSELQHYALSDHVKDFYYTASTSLNAAEGIEPYSTEDTAGANARREQDGRAQFGGAGHGGGFGGMAMGDFSLTGYSSESAMTRFVSGESQITGGAMFDPASPDYDCLISSELAVFNGLTVGDIFTLENPDNEGETYSLTIVGIYENASSDLESGRMMFGTANDPANLICVSYKAVNAMAEQSSTMAVTETDPNGREITTALSLQTSGTFLFGNRADYDSFEREIRDKGLSVYYTLSSSDLNSYAEKLVPLENLSSFASTLLAVILSVGAIVLVVVNIFNIRERKYEVGVLTAIGIKKTKVAAQFVIELLAVTLIAIIIGTGIGAIVSVPVSNNLLSSQIEAQKTVHSSLEQRFGRPGGDPEGGMTVPGGFGGPMFGKGGAFRSSIEYINTINAGVDLSILLQLMGIGILLTIVSSLAGIVFVMRYDPLTILANRD